MPPRHALVRLHAATTLIVVASLVLGFESPIASASPRKDPQLPPAGSVTYGYDAAGRLVGASEPGVGSATHSYDAAGNLTATTPNTGTDPRVFSLTPQHATPGSTVVLRGANFSSTASNDQVSFAGTAATVSAATAGTLTVTVPSSATSGPVNVTVGGTTATGPSFTVDPAGQAPTITGFSVSSVNAGSTFTISGAHFDANPARDVVQINQTRALVAAASGGSLTVAVPQDAVGSGKVVVSTPAGMVTSTTDLYVLPAGLVGSTFDAGQRMSLPGTATLTISGSGHVAMAVFDAPANGRLFVREGTSSVPQCNGALTVYDPHGVSVGSDSCVGTNNILEALPLRTAGTYTVVLSSNGAGGSVPVTLDPMAPDSTAAITTDGTPKTVTTSIGQSADLTFTGTAGQRVFITFSGNSYPRCVSVSLRDPSGAPIAGPQWYCRAGDGDIIDTITLATAGTYTVHIDPPEADTGSLSVAVNTVAADLSIPVSADGSAHTVTTSLGQAADLTFAGTAGQRVFVIFSNGSYPRCVWVSLRDPSGAQLAAQWYCRAGDGDIIDTTTLATTGTYSIHIDPPGADTGSLSVAVSTVAPDSSTAVNADGSSHTVTTSLGQAADLTFTGTAGQRVFIAFSNRSYPQCVLVSLRDPSGAQLTAQWYCRAGDGDIIDTTTLATTGTYSIHIDPPGADTGSLSVAVSTVAPDSSTAVNADGSSHTVTTSLGQAADLTFTGTAGQRVFIAFSNGSYPQCVLVSLRDPSGAQLTAQWYCRAGDGDIIDSTTLATAGTYSIHIDPLGADTGSLSVAVSTVAADLSIPVSADGSAHTVTSSLGQNADLTFTGTAGQKVYVNVSNGSYPSCFSILLRNPAGAQVNYAWYCGGSGIIDTTTLTSDGTYSLHIDPPGTDTGSVTVTITTIVTDLSIPVNADGNANTVTTVSGQNADLTFTGTAGQRVYVNIFNGSYPSCFSILLRDPAGAQVNYAWYCGGGGIIDTTTLTSDGTYSLHIDPPGTDTGSVTVTITTVVPDSSTAVNADGTATVTTSLGQAADVTFTGTAGQRVFVNVSNGNYPHCFSILLRNPAGAQLNYTWYCGGSGIIDTTNLATDGTYSLHIDPPGADIGSVTVAVTQVVPDSSTAVSADGTATATTSLGQAADVTFAGTAGQRVFVNVSNGSYPSCFSILLLNPAGAQLNYVWYCGGGGIIDTTNLATDGTYSLHIDPPGADTGSVTVAVKNVTPDLNVPVSADGSAHTVTTSLGQNADVTFTVTAGQQVYVNVSNGSYPSCFSILLLDPFGGQPNYGWYCGGSAGIPTTTLATAGTYRVHVDPPGPDTGSVTVAVNTVSGGAAPSHVTAGSPPSHTLGATTADELRPVHAVSPRSAAKTHAAVESHSAPALSAAMADELRPVRAERPRPAGKAGPTPPAQPVAAMPRWISTAAGERDAWLPSRSNLAGVDWLSHRTPALAASMPSLAAAPGVTALAGQVLSVGGTPLPGVTLSADGHRARSDRTGRFLLTGISGGQRVLLIDGGTASTASRRFGIFQVAVHAVAGRTTTLGYTIWLTRLDLAHASTIPSPTKKQTILTTPEIPGFEVVLPAGTVVRDLQGHVVRQLSITPVPTDRPPFPLPDGVVTPAYFTVQPGGSYIFPQGAQIIYPNSLHGSPGSRVQFYNYDPNGRGWYVYGGGSVSADGKQVIPDPGVRVWSFTGAMINQPGKNPPPKKKPKPHGPRPGDPIDASSGLFTFDQTDLSESDVLPITLTRSYRQEDINSYAFGPGFNWTYGIWQWSAQEYQQSDLVFPDGSTIHFVRISPGTSWADAVFRATDGWGDFTNAIERWNGNGWDVTGPSGLTYVFGDHQPLQSIRDRYGNQITISRPGGGQEGDITQITSPHGMWIRLSYNSAHEVTQAVDNSGHTVTYSYDASGRLSQVTSATGGITQYTWDNNNRLLTVVDARGHTVASNTYDSDNRVVDQQLGGGGHYLFSYQTDSNDNVTQTDVTDPAGNVTRYAFDAAGGVTSEVRAFGTSSAETWTYTRAAVTDYLTEVVDPHGHHTTYSYDSNGNITQQTVLAGTSSARTTTVDTSGPYGQPVSVTDPLGHQTSYHYDALGDLTSVTDPASHTESYTYLGDGQLASASDDTSDTTSYTYNPLGQWTATVDPLGRITRYFSDAADRPVMVADADGAATFQTWDADNHVTAVTDPDGRQTGYDYDATGNLISITDPAGHTTSYSYDTDGNPTGWAQGTGGPSLTRTFDVADRLSSSIDGRGKKTTVGYDALGRVSAVRYGVTGSSATSTISYGYDADDRPTSITDSVDGTTTVVYDDFGEPTSVSGPHGDIDYSYDASGRLTGETVAGGTPISYGYTVADQLASVSQGSSSASYAYDSDGRLTSASLPGATETYSYDVASQLSSIDYASGSTPLGSLSYAYDPAGRVVGESGSWARLALPDAMTASYNAFNQATTVNGVSRTYDDAGNLTSDGSSTYSWNDRGQLASVTGPGGSESYGYTPGGLRDQVTSGGSSTSYLWDLTGNQVAELSGGSVVAHNLTAGLDNTLVRTDSTGNRTQLTDQLGSVLATVDSSGTIETQNAYTPFGQQATSGNTTVDAPGFTGRTTSPTTDLQYNRDRYYDPTLARFINQDPTGQAGGINTYAYVGGDPINATDPTGDGPKPGTNTPPKPKPKPKPPAPKAPPKPPTPKTPPKFEPSPYPVIPPLPPIPPLPCQGIGGCSDYYGREGKWIGAGAGAIASIIDSGGTLSVPETLLGAGAGDLLGGLYGGFLGAEQDLGWRP